MQILAIVAAIGWTAIQYALFMFSLMCAMGMVNMGDTVLPKDRAWYEFLGNVSTFSYFFGLVLPFISTGVFWYCAIGISRWGELVPALWVGALWLINLIVFFWSITVFDNLRQK